MCYSQHLSHNHTALALTPTQVDNLSRELHEVQREGVAKANELDALKKHSDGIERLLQEKETSLQNSVQEKLRAIEQAVEWKEGIEKERKKNEDIAHQLLQSQRSLQEIEEKGVLSAHTELARLKADLAGNGR